MPFLPQQTTLEGKAPSQPHFALLTNSNGQRTAIPPGASLWMVLDPSDANGGILPFLLKSVSAHKIVLTLMTKDGGQTDYIFKCDTAKLHAMKKERAAVRLKKR
ncbi:MAG: hypothetical protein QM729_21390 [Solirubrobacterales bacterium]